MENRRRENWRAGGHGLHREESQSSSLPRRRVAVADGVELGRRGESVIAFALANALAIPLPDNSVQMVATSPPYYGLRDYSVDGQIGLEQSPREYIAKLVAVFREVRQVLRPDGVLWLNLGDSYGGSGKGRGNGLGGRGPRSNKQLTNKGAYFEIDRNKRNGNGHGRWGGGGQAGKQLMMIPARVAIALQEDGWWLRSEIVWAKPNPMPESVTDRPTRSHEMIYLLAKSRRYHYDAEAVKEPQAPASGPRLLRAVSDNHKNIGGAPGQPPHSMNQPRPNLRASFRRETKEGDVPGKNKQHRLEREHREENGFRNLRDVWTVTPQSYSGAHFATWPEKLVEIMVKAGSRPGDLVLDPFAGSGTTGRVCARLGRRFVGLDLNPEYFKLAAERTDQVQMEIV